MNIRSYRNQLEGALGRYRKSEKARRVNKQHIAKQQKHEAFPWRELDSADRVMRRLSSLGRTELIAEAVENPQLDVLERIIGENELTSAAFIYDALTVARSTGRVVIRSSSGSLLGFGTGFMVSRRLMLTNNHVLESATTAANSTIQFNFYQDFDGQLSTVVEHALEPNAFFRTSAHLDFTLVAVEPINADGHHVADLGWSPFIAESGKTIVGEPVNIIQHPGGEPQQIALRKNRIVDVVDDFLHYEADTQQGSSGSGVFNDQWELSALHHAGVPDKDDQGRILLKSGAAWDGSAATRDQILWVANEGVRISRIVAHLREREALMTAAERTLLQQAFAPRPAFETTEHTVPDVPPVVNGGVRVDADGRATWTIPLDVSVNLGGRIAAASTPRVADGVTDRQRPASTPLPGASDGELQARLRRVEDFADRVYFDEAADADAAETYYADISDDATPAQKFTALSKLVRETHENDFSYSTARHDHLYPWVDLHENENGSRELRSIYSGKNFDPAEFIRLDFEIEQRREALRRELLRDESVRDEEAFAARLEEIESSLPFNCEHVVCQSWFAKKRPMKTDLHHLFSCESNCNSFRSNIPYFQFAPEDEKFRTDCGERTGDKFEPVAGKGAVARATLYFLLRYPDQIGHAGELTSDRLNVLLDWHQQFPVTTYEKHRNAAIFEIQGNRNPLIDWPDWTSDADFKRGFAKHVEAAFPAAIVEGQAAFAPAGQLPAGA